MRTTQKALSKEPRLQKTINKIVTYKPTLKQLFVSIFLIFSLLPANLVLALSATAIQTRALKDEPGEVVISQYYQPLPEEPIVGPMYDYYFKLGPSSSYWEEVAQCETASHWQDDGQWAGGLGIYSKHSFGHQQAGTWERWGGEEFAPTPQQATKFQQIIVANRIAVYGWDTMVYRDPAIAKQKGIPAEYHYIKDPTGFAGWGCIKSKSTRKWRIGIPKQYLEFTVQLPVDPKYYCPAFEPLFKKYGLPVNLYSHIAWKQSRCNITYVHPETKRIGLLQIDPNLFASAMSEFGFVSDDLQNPEYNIIVASWIVSNDPLRIGNWDYTFIYNK